MRDYIEERVLHIGEYIVHNNATVRQAAKEFGVSKSTAHKDAADRLRLISPGLADEVRQVLNINKSERHIRGGMATRDKYSKSHAT